MKLRSLVVDDEAIAGKGLERYCMEIPFIRLEGICGSAFEAKSALEKLPVDLIFLDIRMPGQGGLEFLESLEAPPLVIITTAYPEFALEGYELDVIDYIVKPFSFERFLKACTRAKEYHELKNAVQDRYLFIRVNGRLEKLDTREILFVEARENYVSVQTTKRKYLTLMKLKTMETLLDASQFVRVQKSFLIAKDKVESVQKNSIYISVYKIPISRKWRKEVLANILKT